MRSLVAWLVISGLSITQASADQAFDQLLACRRTPDSAARLECFDRASDAVLLGQQSAPAAVPSPVASVATSASPLKSATVESNIVRISRPISGPVNFTLENGQVWRQMDSDDARSAKVGDRVIVSKKFFAGAYWLRIDGGRAWRVTLVR